MVSYTYQHNNFLIHSIKIQLTFQGRIISGYAASPGQFPWQVIIKQDEYDELLCGGSIISDTWVLTAAHCCFGFDSLFLIFGTIELFDETALNMTSTELNIHPDYNSTTYNNDVCLIELPYALEFTTNISSISLLPNAMRSTNLTGSIATIAGFGVMNDVYMDASENLLWAQIQIIENSDCSKVYEPGLVISSTICGQGYEIANMSICNGDSGGPLILKDATYGWIQIGINSFVPLEQCTEALPSAYARISSFLDYIYNITGLGDQSGNLEETTTMISEETESTMPSSCFYQSL